MHRKHIENIRKYLDDLQETNLPWTRWQVKQEGDKNWENLNYEPIWAEKAEYRRKPDEIKKEISFSKPVTKELKPGERYWTISSFSGEFRIFKAVWTNHYADNSRLEEGLIHLTEEAAQEHLDAILSVFKPFEKKRVKHSL